MAEDGGESSNPNVKWGIYDRLKKVPPFSSPKAPRVVVLSPRGQKMDSTEKAAETAARKMVEDHFKQQENHATDPMADFLLIESNEFPHRGHKQQDEEDIMVCKCVDVDGDADSTCGKQCLNVLSNTECRPSHCPCREQCKNQKFQQNQYAKVNLVKTVNKGWGLSAGEDLKAGDFVVEYCGEVVPNSEAYFRAKGYEASGSKDSYIFSVNAAEFIDGTRKGSMGRFVNHSCEPICEMQKWAVLGEDRIGIFASVDITVGTELTCDYLKSQWFSGSPKVTCACGTKSCVGKLEASPKGLHHRDRDAYAWEDDDTERQEEAQLSNEEDDAPLSSFMKSLVPRKCKGVSSTKGTGNDTPIAAADKATAVRALSTAKSTPLVKDPLPLETIKGESSVFKTPESSSILAKRNRTVVARRGDDIVDQIARAGKLKETPPPETRFRKGITKLPAKPDALEEEEIKLANKRAKSDAEAQGETTVVASSAEQLRSDNLSRVAAFQQARIAFNRQLATDESLSSFLVSEAACAEVEFAQELETAAMLDLRKVRDDIHPAIQYFQKLGQEASPAVVEKWMAAHCKRLHSSLDFHFSIVRHLAGPTFAWSQPPP